jgi:replicative superfamily II helicase
VPSFQQSCWIPDDIEDLIGLNYPLQSFIATSMRDWLDGRDMKDAQSSLIGMHARDFRRIVAAFRMMGFDQTYSKALEAMITQGVGMELIPLVGVKGIGRKKAQDLYRQGITRPEQILDSVVARNILGPKGYINACNQMATKGDKIILVF